MSLMRWDPFEDLWPFRRSMDRLFDEFFARRLPRVTPPEEWEPAVEVFEADGDVVVRAELPNIDPKQVDITVTDDTITLRGETKHEEERKGKNYYRRELRYGAFMRILPLPTEVKGTEAKAVYKDGVLEIKIPKSEKVKPIPIRVQAAA